LAFLASVCDDDVVENPFMSSIIASRLPPAVVSARPPVVGVIQLADSQGLGEPSQDQW
jgi:hypothetical protein